MAALSLRSHRARKGLALVLLATFFTAAPTARAGFIGSTVSVVQAFPNTGNIIGGPTSALVGPGIEFVAFAPAHLDATIDVADNSIKITQLNATIFTPLPFNGAIFTFTGAPTITGLSLDGSSSFAPFAFTFTGNTVSVNFQGTTPPSVGAFSQLNVNFAPVGSAVPLPPAFWTALAGVGMGCWRMRSKLVAA